MAPTGGRPVLLGSRAMDRRLVGIALIVASAAGFGSGALFAKGVSNANYAARKSVYKQISAELENNAVWIWMFTSYDYRVHTKKLVGFKPMANGSLFTLATAKYLK